MSKQFIFSIKIISYILGIGYLFFLVLPLIANAIFTISMGLISDKFSYLHIMLYLSLLLFVVVLYLLFKIWRTNEGKKVLYLFSFILLAIFIYHFSLTLLNNAQNKKFEDLRINTAIERENFLKNHCVEIPGELDSKSIYKCDDGSIR